jgi:hypothetical protein
MTSGTLRPDFVYPEDPLEKIIAIENLVPLTTDEGSAVGNQYLEYDTWKLDDAVALLMGFAPSKGAPFLQVAAHHREAHSLMADALRLADMIGHAQQSGRLSACPSPEEYLSWLSSKRFPGGTLYKAPSAIADHKPLTSVIETFEKKITVLENDFADSLSILEEERSLHETTKKNLAEANETIKKQNIASIPTLKKYVYGLAVALYREHSKTNDWTHKGVAHAWNKLGGIVEGDEATFRDYVKDGEKLSKGKKAATQIPI